MPTATKARAPRASAPHASAETRERLIAATRHLVAKEGFARTTIRAIGEEAGCNSALVSYHFGSLRALLVAALDASSQEQLERYRTELEEVRTWRGMRTALRGLRTGGRDRDHERLLAEMVAGGVMDPELGRQVAVRIGPWIDLVEEVVSRVVRGPLRRRLPTREIAYATVALFLGLELVGGLSGDEQRDDDVIDRLLSLGMRRAAPGDTR